MLGAFAGLSQDVSRLGKKCDVVAETWREMAALALLTALT